MINFLKPNKQKLIIWVILLLISSPYLLASILRSVPSGFLESFSTFLSALFFFLTPISLIINAPVLLPAHFYSYQEISLLLIIYSYLLSCVLTLIFGVARTNKFPKKLFLMPLIYLMFFALLMFAVDSFYTLVFLVPFLILTIVIFLMNFKTSKKLSLVIFLIQLYVLVISAFFALMFFQEKYCNFVVETSGVSQQIVEPTAEEKREGITGIFLSHRVRRECSKNFKLLPALIHYYQSKIQLEK